MWVLRGRRQGILPTVKDKLGECLGQTSEAAVGTSQLRSSMCLEVSLHYSRILLSHKLYTGSAASVPTRQVVSGAATKNSFTTWAASVSGLVGVCQSLAAGEHVWVWREKEGERNDLEPLFLPAQIFDQQTRKSNQSPGETAF